MTSNHDNHDSFRDTRQAPTVHRVERDGAEIVDLTPRLPDPPERVPWWAWLRHPVRAVRAVWRAIASKE